MNINEYYTLLHFMQLRFLRGRFGICACDDTICKTTITTITIITIITSAHYIIIVLIIIIINIISRWTFWRLCS